MTEHNQNIYQRLNAVREEVQYLKKDADVQGYQAITHDAVTAHVRGSLVKHGVMIVPRQSAGEAKDVGQTQKGATIIRYEATYEIDFVNIDEPKDIVTIPLHAHANDQGDKAPGKALSYAVKYALLKIFNIETGENEESRVDAEVKAAPITAEQYTHLQTLMEETETDPDAFLRYLNSQPSITVNSLPEMKEGVYQFSVQALEAKKRKQSDGTAKY